MQLTSFTDYGLRALIYMASLPEGKMTSISEVTEVYGVSRNHMVKIINQLSRAGYVTAVRGKNGGIRLGKPAKDVRVGDVVRELEPLTLVNCSSEFCHITPACRLKQALSQAVQSFLKELDNYTLADLVEKNQPLYNLLLVEYLLLPPAAMMTEEPTCQKILSWNVKQKSTPTLSRAGDLSLNTEQNSKNRQIVKNWPLN